MKVKNIKGAGRPHLDKRIVKVPVGLRIQSWLVDWMRAQPEAQAMLIEHALCKTYNIEPPKID